MAFWPNHYTTQQELRTKTPDGRDLVFLTGYAVFNLKGTGANWRREDLYMAIGPQWQDLDDVAAVVTPASFSNSNHAMNAGWAVDNCRRTTWNKRILLQSQLAVRDSDGYIHRVAYQITAIGKL